MTLLLEQILNGLQLGVTLFLMAAGLTLIFGIMGIINLAHGSLYMVGAYAGTAAAAATGSFWLAIPFALAAAALAGVTIEALVIRRLYRRDHLDQVLATFALILIANQLVTILFGRAPLFIALPAGLRESEKLEPPIFTPATKAESGHDENISIEQAAEIIGWPQSRVREVTSGQRTSASGAKGSSTTGPAEIGE